MKYNVKVTKYNGEIQLTVYSSYIHRTDEEVKDEIAKHYAEFDEQFFEIDEQNILSRIKTNQVRSRRRSKQTIYNICRANEWNYFATFTFASDRYDYDSCKKRLQYFLNNFSKRKVHIEYLIVPEQHKDGAWHFHALIQADLSDYLTKGWNKGRFILPDYSHGINEFEPVRDTQRVSMYITKYITKELQNVMQHKHRFLCSRNLKRGDESYFAVGEDFNLIDFVQSNFPEYDFSYAKNAEFGDGSVKYIQLKRGDADV